MLLPSPPPALATFQRAQSAWEAHRLPPYVEFDVHIEHRDSTGKITTGREHVLLRTFDHWCKTSEIDSDSTQMKTSMGLSCVGPGASPLGFNIASHYPNSTQIDPFSSQLRTVASVRAIHYFVQLAGEDRIDGYPCYHLVLRPIHDPEYYPLRAVWVDEASWDVRRLTYAMQQNGWSGSIDYSFRPFAVNTWWISSIDARWTPPSSDRSDPPFSSTLNLTGVTFPGTP